MGTKMLRGPSLKSLSLLRTFYLIQIIILTISGGKGSYLDNLIIIIISSETSAASTQLRAETVHHQ